jgi:hypothetical protein
MERGKCSKIIKERKEGKEDETKKEIKSSSFWDLVPCSRLQGVIFQKTEFSYPQLREPQIKIFSKPGYS